MKTVLLQLLLVPHILSCAQESVSKEVSPKLQDIKTRLEEYARTALEKRNTNADTSLYYAQKAIELSKEVNDPFGKLLAIYSMGQAQSVKAHYRTAITYFEEARDLAKSIKDDSLSASALEARGVCLWQLGNHAEAIEDLFSSIKEWEKTGNWDGIISCKVNIGMIYQSQDKPGLAEQYIKEALGDLEKHHSTRIKITALHTLANIYGMQGKIREALSLDSAGIDLCEKSGNKFSKAMFFDNMGNCYMYGDPPDYKRSYDYFRRTIEIDSSFGNQKQMSDSYLNLGILFTTQKKFNQAISHFLRSVSLADSSGYMQGKQLAFQNLADVYRQSGNDAKAFDALKDANHIQDSLVNEKSETVIAELQTVYETGKKERQIALQKEQLSKKNYMISGAILIFILSTLSSYLFYRRYRLRQKNKLQAAIMKQQELSAKAVMEAEESERQRIAKDLHDGVGQMMSAAKMNLSAFESEIKFADPAQKISFEKIIALVDDGCKEVRSVSHNMMPNALLKKNLAAAIREFIEKLDNKVIRVHLHTEGLDERLDSNIETVLYRVIQESVNNVLKHSGANHLDISVIRDRDGISATIEDNGRGFDAANHAFAEGIGLKNIRTRVEYLKGTVDFDTAPGKGTLVAIHVPLS